MFLLKKKKKKMVNWVMHIVKKTKKIYMVIVNGDF